jgi:chromosome segregation ATPase
MTSIAITPRVSEETSRSRFMDADMDEDMPMDELQQVLKSRYTEPTSIHPPQLVSPLNDSSDAVSSVSSSDGSPIRRTRKSQQHQQHPVVTPPSSSGSGSRHAATSRNFGTSHDAAAVEPKDIVQSQSFDSTAASRRYASRSSSYDVVEIPPRPTGHYANDGKVEYARRQLEESRNSRKPVAPSIDRLATAIRTKSNRRPEDLSKEENALWDAVQGTLSGQRSEMMARRRILERQLQESTSQVDKLRVHNITLKKELDTTVTHLQNAKRQLHDMQASEAKQRDNSSDEQVAALEAHVADLQLRYDKAVELTEACQDEHDRAICAIQRVLADVNEQKEEQVAALQARIKELQDEIEQQQDESSRKSNNDAADVGTLRARAQRAFQLEKEMEELKNSQARTEEERDQLQQDLDKKTGIIAVLEQELNVIKNALQNAKDKEAGFEEVITRQRKQLAQQVNSHLIAPACTPSEELESLRRKMEEKTKSLENAKALITSLEAANGSMAVDLRSKLKGKDEQVLILQSEAADRKRRMDSLATELKDLQIMKTGSVESSAKMREQMSILSQSLESAVGELQSASIILESSDGGEEEAVDTISVILCNAVAAIKSSLEAIKHEGGADTKIDREIRPDSRGFDSSSHEVEDKLKKMDTKLKLADASLKKAEGEVALLKVQNERLRLSKSHEESKMKEEIRHLRSQCENNLEALEKKKQELQVLRDSLEVGDEVGYISGDETDEEEENQETGTNTGTATSQDALNALLARGGVDMAGTVNAAELNKMKNELKRVDRERQRAKEALKAEQESLANAKMIISSLEKANKTMLEDLRSRLQDSNTAIAALLDKSLVNEKVSKDLEQRLEQLTKEKEKADADHEAEIAKLKSEALITALRLAAKEREVAEYSST